MIKLLSSITNVDYRKKIGEDKVDLLVLFLKKRGGGQTSITESSWHNG